MLIKRNTRTPRLSKLQLIQRNNVNKFTEILLGILISKLMVPATLFSFLLRFHDLLYKIYLCQFSKHDVMQMFVYCYFFLMKVKEFNFPTLFSLTQKGQSSSLHHEPRIIRYKSELGIDAYIQNVHSRLKCLGGVPVL